MSNENKRGPKGKYGSVAAAARQDYETGKYTYEQLAAKYGVSQSSISKWAVADQWGKRRARVQRQMNFRAECEQQLRKQISKANEEEGDWTDNIQIIKELSEQVRAWRQHDLKMKKDEAEADRAAAAAESGSIRQTMNFIEWMLSWLQEKNPSAFREISGSFKQMVADYKVDKLS